MYVTHIPILSLCLKAPIDSHCEDSVRGLWNDQERHNVPGTFMVSCNTATERNHYESNRYIYIYTGKLPEGASHHVSSHFLLSVKPQVLV